MLTAIKPTIIKAEPTGSQYLAPSQKASLAAKRSIQIKDSAPAGNQHIWVQFTAPVRAIDGRSLLEEGYAYIPHVQISGIAGFQRDEFPIIDLAAHGMPMRSDLRGCALL